jgi:hypothetical protein
MSSSEAPQKVIKMQLKNTGISNHERIEMMDHMHMVDAGLRPSYLQLKYPANLYPYAADPDYIEDTDDTVHMMMRDILENGFTTILSVGSNRQEFYCIFDTGSSVMFVNSFQCEAEHCEMNAQFDSETSETFVDLDETIELTYGGGFLNGEEVSDSVWLHDIEVPEQVVALVTDEDSGSTINFSCLVGLSYPSLAPNGELLFFDNIIERGLLENNLFTVYYYIDGEHADLTFGEVDQDFYTGDITYATVQKFEHWNIEIEDILIDGESLNFCESGCQGLVDTGTNLNTFETEQMDIIFEYIHHGGQCGALSDLPTLTYVINGTNFDFKPEEYYIESEDTRASCVPGMFAMDVFMDEEHPSMVLGVMFMQKYFTIFDRDNDRVGFALANTDLDVPQNPEADQIETNAD